MLLNVVDQLRKEAKGRKSIHRSTKTAIPPWAILSQDGMGVFRFVVMMTSVDQLPSTAVMGSLAPIGSCRVEYCDENSTGLMSLSYMHFLYIRQRSPRMHSNGSQRQNFHTVLFLFVYNVSNDGLGLLSLLR